MNRRMVLHNIGRLLILEGVLMLLPTLVALIYKEQNGFFALGISALGTIALGSLLYFGIQRNEIPIFSREGFAIVALSWVIMSATGAMPFVISGEIPSFVDAFFETVSGFTTTGASILTDVESMSHGLLFWRSFTHFLGGMGILVLMVALLPTHDRTIHILRAEMPGPSVEKFVPKAKDTAKILYLIYLVLTAVEIIFLCAGGMSLFESTVHAFGTAGTGGFGIKATSIGGYSPYLQWVIGIFMVLFGVNFNIYYFILAKRLKNVLRNEEMWLYLAIVAVATALITWNLYPLYHNFSQTLRLSFFQVSSIITTTGYATADFNLWPTFSKAVLLILMCIGGCAGSTAGGIKVSRLLLICKNIKKEQRKLLHPRAVEVVRMDGKPVNEGLIGSLGAYTGMYILMLIVGFFLVSFDSFNFEESFTAVISCANNVGPAFGIFGPAGNYSAFSGFSKLVLSFAMLFGRLEIVPLLVTFSPSTWTKK